MEAINFEDFMDESDAINMLINPYYAVNISPDLAGEHEPLVTEEQWTQANLKLIDEIDARKWLEHLLAVLQGDYLVGPDDPDIPGGYRAQGDEGE
jgi:hypothetical protein